MKKEINNKNLILFIAITAITAYLIYLYNSYFLISSDIAVTDDYPLDLTPFPFKKISSNRCKHLPIILHSESYLIQDAMIEEKNGNLIKNKKVFLMLNGENSGVYLSWDAKLHSNCLYELAYCGAKELGASDLDLSLPLMLYSSTGIPISSFEDIEKSKRLIHVLYDQEVWVWPGINIGYEWTINNIKLKTLSLSPKVIEVQRFLSKEECDEVISVGQNLLQPSPSISVDDSQFPNYRTSSTAFIYDALISKSVAVKAQQLLRLPFKEYVESIQLVKYHVGQWFKEHTDYFDHFNLSQKLIEERYHSTNDLNSWISNIQQHIARYGGTVPSHLAGKGEWYPRRNLKFKILLAELLLKNISQNKIQSDLISKEWLDYLQLHIKKSSTEEEFLDFFLSKNKKIFPLLKELWEEIAGEKFKLPEQVKFIEPNRHATLFLYLNDVEEGGETVFPLSDEKNSENIERKGMKECSEGLTVKPSLGNAALFYSKTPDGRNDEKSYHGGCPPVKGIKYGSNVFVWNTDATYGVEVWGF